MSREQAHCWAATAAAALLLLFRIARTYYTWWLKTNKKKTKKNKKKTKKKNKKKNKKNKKKQKQVFACPHASIFLSLGEAVISFPSSVHAFSSTGNLILYPGTINTIKIVVFTGDHS